MDFCLTRESEALLSVLYREYCTRRKHGIPIVKASYFQDAASIHDSFLPALPVDDIAYLCWELQAEGLLDVSPGDDTANDITLTRVAVAYLDHKFTRGLSSVVAFLTDLSSILSWLT